MTDTTTVVWIEIPVSDVNAAMTFYNAVFGWALTLDTTGPNPIAVFGGGSQVGGHLYPGATAPGSTVHLAVDDLAAATERARLAGAEIGMGPIQIPPGRFTYISDPDGNSLGLFQPGKAA